MSTVRGVTGATEEDFKSLRDEAQRLGATTRFSATQAAEGMLFLARAGFEADQVMAAIGDTLNLAQAGALDLGRAADIASNVLKGFNLEAEETTRIVDVLTVTSNSANTNIEQLGQAMSFAAPAAAAIGVSVEQAAASIGVLSDAGVQATRAGTSLRQIFVKLLKPTGSAKKAIEGMGITAKDLNVQARGLLPVLETLRDRNISLSEAADLVGTRQAANLLIMIKSIDRLKELELGNENAAGAAAEMARIMDDNLKGALFAVKSAFEAVILAIGDFGADESLTNFMRSLATGLRNVAMNIDDVIAAAKVLAIGFVALRIPRLVAQIKLLTLAIAANPLGALVVALTATIALMTFLRDEIKLTTDGTVTLADGMKAASDTIGSSITEAVNLLGGSFENFDELATTALENLGRGLIAVLAIVNGTVRAMIVAFDDFPRALKEIAVFAFNGFLAVVETSLNVFIKAINTALDFLGISKQAIEPFDLSRLELAGTEGGSSLAAAFKEGFDATIAGTLTASAERRAQEAAKAAAGATAGGGALGVPAGAAGTTGPSRPDEATRDFNKLLEGLRNENSLLLLTNRERAIRSTLLAAEDELGRKLTATERAQVEALAEENAKLTVQGDVLNELRGPQEAYQERLEAINTLLAKGIITQDQANQKLRDARITILDTQTTVGAGFERGFLKAQRSMEDFASSSEELITDAFAEAQSAVVNFFKTGEFSLQSFFSSLANNLLQLGTQSLFASIFGGGGIGGGGGGGGGFGALLGGLIGFQHGGEFAVNQGSAAANLTGTDNRLIAFRAQDGEKVSVTPRGQQGVSRTNRIVNNFNFPPGTNPTGFRRSQSSIEQRQSAGMRRADSRNG